MAWVGGDKFIAIKRGGKGKSGSGQPQGRRKTRMYYCGLRMGPPNKKHGRPASMPSR